MQQNPFLVNEQSRDRGLSVDEYLSEISYNCWPELIGSDGALGGQVVGFLTPQIDVGGQERPPLKKNIVRFRF